MWTYTYQLYKYCFDLPLLLTMYFKFPLQSDSWYIMFSLVVHISHQTHFMLRKYTYTNIYINILIWGYFATHYFDEVRKRKLIPKSSHTQKVPNLQMWFCRLNRLVEDVRKTWSPDTGDGMFCFFHISYELTPWSFQNNSELICGHWNNRMTPTAI